MNTPSASGRWFRQPILWLGALILAVSLVGCIAIIILASRHADAPLETVGGSVMKVPSGHRAAAPAEREASSR